MTIETQNEINQEHRPRRRHERLAMWLLDTLFLLVSPLVAVYVLFEERRNLRVWRGRLRNFRNETALLERCWGLTAVEKGGE